jgi:peptidoglycan LD-endopeptidase CwlK
MDRQSEERLSKVHPILANKVRTMADQLQQEGIYVRVVQGLRSIEEQDALYAQGRTSPGKIVTDCRGGFSYHNFGLAADVVPSEAGIDKSYNPDWDESHPTWKRMVQIAESLGLNAGADWRTFRDWPHFQLTGKYPVGHPPDEVRNVYRSGGLKAVWKATGISDSVQDLTGEISV